MDPSGHIPSRSPGSRRPVVILLAAALLLGVECAGTPKRVAWENRLCLAAPEADFFAEPGITEVQCRSIYRRFRAIESRLVSQFFPNYDPAHRKLSIVLYRDHDSYNRYRVVPIKSLADYNRVTHTIHIAVESPEFVWRHETTHALLEALRPNSPYWLHEGLALFVQNQNLPASIHCDGKALASMPVELEHFIEDLRARPLLIPGHHGAFQLNEKKAGLSLGLSGYFVFYIWDRQQLTRMLNIYQTTDQKALFILTGSDPELRAFLHEDFKRWIRTAQPTRLVPGC